MFRLIAKRAAARPATRSTMRVASKRSEATLSSPAFKEDPSKGKEFVEAEEKVEEHSKKGASTWEKVSLFLALPAIALVAYPVYKEEAHHAEHRKELKKIPDEDWPKQYPYMNTRAKDFFWGDGDKTLFWNEGVNRHVKD